MKITNLTIDNWGAVGSASLALNDRGLLLIQGQNLDDTSQISNGAGKSTIPEALSWCFYGETAKGETGDKIVNRKAGKDTAVVALIEDDNGDVYRVARYRKHHTYKNQLRLELQDSGTAYWKDLTQGTDKLTQPLVDKLIGCNYEVFTSAIYAGQEAMPDLPGMTDKALKVLIEEAAGIAKLQAASDMAAKVVKERKQAVADSSQKIMTIQATMNTLEESALQAEAQRAGYEVQREDGKKLVQARLDEKKAAFKPEFGDRLSEGVKKVRAQADEVKAKIAGSDAERDKERELERELNQASSLHANATLSFDRMVADAKNLKHRLDHVADRVGTSCGECGHVIEASDLAGAEASAKTAAQTAVKAAKELKVEVEKALAAQSEASSALDAHRASMTDVSAMTAQLNELAEKERKLQEALVSWAGQKEMIENDERKLVELGSLVNPYIKTIDDAKARIDKAKLEMDVIDVERTELSAALDVAEEVAALYGPAGVRAHILDTVTPHLNSRTSHYLSALTDGNVSAIWSTISKTAKGELREKFVIDIESKTGGESYKSLSGGEKRKVRLACAMALQDLVACRAAKPVALWVADEIDHALDDAGLERLMILLDEKSREKGTVLVISHSDLSDFIRNSITVQKKDGVSTIL